MKVTDLVTQLAQPVVESFGCSLWDVEYVREGSERYLRLYIDKEGGIFINDCELVSRALSEILDKDDPIEDAYILEVSSPGLGRPIKKDKDFQRNLGDEVEIRTYKPINKQKGDDLPVSAFKDYEDGRIDMGLTAFESIEKSMLCAVSGLKLKRIGFKKCLYMVIVVINNLQTYIKYSFYTR